MNLMYREFDVRQREVSRPKASAWLHTHIIDSRLGRAASTSDDAGPLAS